MNLMIAFQRLKLEAISKKGIWFKPPEADKSSKSFVSANFIASVVFVAYILSNVPYFIRIKSIATVAAADAFSQLNHLTICYCLSQA